jgi:hypothetical protein
MAPERSAWREGFGKRLVDELGRLDLSQSEIARRLRCTKQLVSQWCAGRSEILSYDLVRLRHHGLDPTYILTGIRSDASSAVPYPDQQQLLAIVGGQLQADQVERRVATFVRVENGIAVDVGDNGLGQRLPAKSIAIVDRDREPGDGDVVGVVLCETQECLVRRYLGGGPRGDVVFVLQAASPLFPDRPVTAGHRPVVLGVLAESIIPGSR